jgi:hypothetical protein
VTSTHFSLKFLVSDWTSHLSISPTNLSFPQMG